MRRGGGEAAAEDQAMAAMGVDPAGVEDLAEEPELEVERVAGEDAASGVGTCPANVDPRAWATYRAAMSVHETNKARVKSNNDEKAAAKKALVTYTDTLRNCLSGAMLFMSTLSGPASERAAKGIERFQLGMIHHCLLRDHQHCPPDASCHTRPEPHPPMNELAKNLLRTFVLQQNLATILKKCVNHGSTSNNESFNNVLHMFVSKRIVYKAWKAARTGARKNAVVPKAFQAKRKDDTSWSFAAEAIGRLKRRVMDPSYRFTSGWLDLKPPEEEAPAPAPRKTWGKAKAMAANAARVPEAGEVLAGQAAAQ